MSGKRIFWSGLFLAVLPAIAGLGLDLPAMAPPGPLKFAAASFIINLPILVLLVASALYAWQAGRRHPRAWVRIASRINFVAVIVAFAFGTFALGVSYTEFAEGKSSFTSEIIAAGSWLAPVGLALAVQVVDWIIQGRVSDHRDRELRRKRISTNYRTRPLEPISDIHWPASSSLAWKRK